MKKQLFSDYRCFPPFEGFSWFPPPPTPSVWLECFILLQLHSEDHAGAGEAKWNLYVWKWLGGRLFHSIYDSIQSTFGGNICASLGAAEAAPVRRAFVYILDHPEKCSLDTHRPLAMREAVAQESSSEVRLWPLDQKIPVYILSLILLSGRDASLEDGHGWPGNKLFQQTLASSWPSFAQAKHPLVSPNRRCSATVFIATEKIKKHFEGIEMEKGSLVSQVCLACMKPWGQSMHLK